VAGLDSGARVVVEIAWIVDSGSTPMDDSARRDDSEIEYDNVIVRSLGSESTPRPGPGAVCVLAWRPFRHGGHGELRDRVPPRP
jgi:hypothetical protein